MEIGAQIKTRRQDLNMTQEMLAKELHVGRTTVSNWEIGRNYPDLQLIVSISNVLSISIEYFIGYVIGKGKRNCERDYERHQYSKVSEPEN